MSFICMKMEPLEEHFFVSMVLPHFETETHGNSKIAYYNSLVVKLVPL